ncbi:MAG: PGF-pre-PGF domain-containing protein/surface glycoprotein (TIGR04207 family) [Natronomonas sp.]|jgi:PGF-pre-PGF domain-containing protein/surface glycoprotein (TIGR04207 family)|uniref:PGF-pre-PGF domain-containing protein n=1 Tax=Natronomonas sp. TaxID=2184060 RepID=UPI0039897203
MTTGNEHKLRALLLASLMALSVVAGSVAFVGGAAASSYELQASDGAGGGTSTLFANFNGQLPQGVESGNDTLQVEATNETLPETFFGEVRLDSQSDVTFDQRQSQAEFELVVYGEDGTVDTENVTVNNFGPKTIEYQADYSGSSGPLTGEEAPVGVRIRNLTFNATAPENATLEWEIDNEVATHKITVQEFNADIEATDENGRDVALVTAGAYNQSMVGLEDSSLTGSDPARNLTLRGNESEFPSRFKATVSLEGDGITFDGPKEEIDVYPSNGSANITSLDDRSMVVSVSGFDGNTTDAAIIELAGVTYNVTADANETNVVWDIRGQTDNYTLAPERLDASLQETYEFPRGRDSQPDGNATLVIDGTSKLTSGFHKENGTMVVTAPQGGLTFDASSQPDGNITYPGTLGITQSEDLNVQVTEEELRFDVPRDVGNEETVTVRNISFNTTGFDETQKNESADFTAGLDVEYTPVNRLNDVNVSTGNIDELKVTVPKITIEGDEPTKLELNQNDQSGTAPIAINTTDITGGQIAAGTEVVIGIDGSNNITFNESQNLETGGIFSAQTKVADPIAPQEIRVQVINTTETSEGDTIILRQENDTGIRFDAADADPGASARFTVQTNASDANVTQVTGLGVAVMGNRTLSTSTENLTVDKSKTVTVTVKDQNGTLLDGVNVTASGSALNDKFTKTSSNGTVSFSLTPDSEGQIEFDAAGAVPATIEANRANITAEPKEILANEETTVTVNVTGADGTGLDGVSLEASGDPLPKAASATTDNGTASFTFEPEQAGTITIDATNLSGVETTVDVTGIQLDRSEITAGQSTNVTVTVENGSGGIEDVNVTAFGEPLESNETNTTDSDGQATLNLDPTRPGTITVQASGRDFEIETGLASVANITLEPEQVTAGNEMNVTATVTGANKTALENITVEATGGPLDGTKSDTTPSNGTVTFNINATQGGEITLNATDIANVSATLEVINATLDLNRSEISAGKTTTVTATVNDTNGSVEGANVTAFGEPLGNNSSATTGENGTAALELDPTQPGTITVQASGKDFEIETSVVSVGDITIEPESIEAGNESNVTVNVTGANGNPLDGITVNASGDPLNGTVTNTTSDGEAVLSLSPDQGGQITVTGEEIGNETTLDVVGPKINSSVEKINATDETTVTFTVTNESGDPIEGVSVNASGPVEGELNNSTNSDGKAQLTLNPTDVGTIPIEANKSQNGFPITTEVESVASIAATPTKITAGDTTDVTVNVTGVNESGLDNADVAATGGPLDSDVSGTTEANGSVTLSLNTTEAGTITIAADNVSINTSVEAIANIEPTPTSVDANETTNVSVNLTGASNEPIEDVRIEARGAPLDESVSSVTDDNGTVTLELEPNKGGTITIAADELGVDTEINAEAESSNTGGSDNTGSGNTGGGNTGGGSTSGGGGGGGGAAPAPTPSANMTVTDATLSTTEIEAGETVNVTAPIENTGDAEGEYTVRVQANSVTVATETVNISTGETVEVTLPVAFDNPGERVITVGDVEAGTVTIEGDETEQTVETPPEAPESAIAANARPITDAAPDDPGVQVEFENVTVRAITFSNASNGTAMVADLETLPTDVEETPGPMVRAMEINVPAELEDQPATIQFSVSESEIDGDADDVRLARYNDGGWELYQPDIVEQSGGEVVYEAETPGFSTFAVYEQQEQQDTQTPTATATETPPGDAEVGFLGSFGMVALGIVAVIAVLLAVAGARVYQQNEL